MNLRILSFFKRKLANLLLMIILLWILYYFINQLFKSGRLYRPDPDRFVSQLKVIPYIQQNHVLMILRTSHGTQWNRIPAIIRTWFNFSPEHIHITSNGNRKFLLQYVPVKYHHQIHISNCKQAHSIPDLCCNSGREFDIFFRSENQYKWLCRFDDDQYVNVPLLIRYLERYSPDKQALYIGKPSMKEPKNGHGLKFWFATYGGGVCFSKRLLKLIRNEVYPSHRFVAGCIASKYPDDTHIAYVLKKKYNISLTVADDFHHHIEKDLFTNITNATTIERAITLGFKGTTAPRFEPLFPRDTFHMQTLHCLLYPTTDCMRLVRNLLNKIYEQKQS